MFDFTPHAEDGAARTGTFTTPHGEVETPVFMPVGTSGSVKGVSPEEVRATGASMILANTYHLYLRPGHELVRELGGVHDFHALGRTHPHRLGRLPGPSRLRGAPRSETTAWSFRATSTGPVTSSRPRG